MNAPTRRPGDVNVDISGEGAAGFGYVHLLNLSLVGGDWREVAGDVRRWSVWNWPQFLLVLLLDAVALLTAPDDTSTGAGWLYGVMVVTLVLSFGRVAGVVGVLADRAGPAGRTSLRRSPSGACCWRRSRSSGCGTTTSTARSTSPAAPRPRPKGR